MFDCIDGWVLDFSICNGVEELKQVMIEINVNRYKFVTVTQSGDTYTVFFRVLYEGWDD